jgi:hypothetical protein
MNSITRIGIRTDGDRDEEVPKRMYGALLDGGWGSGDGSALMYPMRVRASVAV